MFHQAVDQQNKRMETAHGNNLNQENTPQETTDSRVPDPGMLSIALVQHEEWEFDGKVSQYSCPMATESDRMEFRRYFILVVLKMFLCPIIQQVISPWHIYPVLDVSDPRRFNWPLHNLKWLDKAVEKYKLKGNKTCEGCMFVVLVGCIQ
ncbi:hypothetical protein HN51_063322 [Arachis hypogaea]